MNKAVFLDRDGVINREQGDYTWQPDHFELVEGLLPNLQRLTRAGFLLVVISNQSGIAKGMYGHADVTNLHEKLLSMVAEQGVHITDLFYCPHHPDHGRCLCRKPEGILIEKAVAKYGIDVDGSFMIGDRQRDINAASKAGVKGYLVDSNQDISEIVDDILRTEG